MAKTVEQLLISVRRNLMEKTGLRYRAGTTTSAGVSDGTTLVDSGLNVFKDDLFNGCVARLSSGNGANQKQPLISDFTGSSGTVTVVESFGVQVGASVTYEIMERGIWDDAQLIEILNSSQDALLDLLVDDALLQLTKRANADGTTGVGDVPTDLLRFISVEANGYSVGIVKPDERNRLQTDAFRSESITRPVGMFVGGKLRYYPASNVTLNYNYVPRMAELTTSQDCQLPDHLASLLVLKATSHAFSESEDFDNAKFYNDMAMQRIQAINTQYADRAYQKVN